MEKDKKRKVYLAVNHCLSKRLEPMDLLKGTRPGLLHRNSPKTLDLTTVKLWGFLYCGTFWISQNSDSTGYSEWSEDAPVRCEHCLLKWQIVFLQNNLNDLLLYKGQKHLVCQSNISGIYSIKQSSHHWNSVLERLLSKMGFTQTSSDLYVYYMASEGEMFSAWVYVNNKVEPL